MTPNNPIRRRDFLRIAAGCCATGGLGLYPALSLAAEAGGGHPLAPRPSHFPGKAKQMILLFMTGGMSHLDTFDPKPALRERHGQKVEGGYIKGGDFTFARCGKSGLEISELFPHLQKVADELCVIRSMYTDHGDHFQGTLAMHTGSASVPLPSLGSWISYGLGTENPNLPSYMVLAKDPPYAGGQVWDNSFLPAYHQGVRITPGEEPIPDIRPAARSASLADLERVMLEDFNKLHSSLRPEDLRLPSRMATFNTAKGMMSEAPAVFDLSAETDKTLEAYGIQRGDSSAFGWQCLVARRLIERGVRVVELIDRGAGGNWDSHSNMEDHRKLAEYIDRGVSALISDLAERGLLDQTLIVGCTEFGRTPHNPKPDEKGRGHHRRAFSCFLSGGGAKGGYAHGESDEIGMEVAKDKVHVHDFHATILHLMGFDHERLTYRYGGRDYRLTDVHGNVVKEILA
ncbi:MAG: DUF1501 domain-containing protein [Candidatus Omnitrophica bacterium]|nr:hypothetical protein [bacterium]NUN96840.1 DUF1501 domain-containing protein [Candidatus Omnitrophota bacterium]